MKKILSFFSVVFLFGALLWGVNTNTALAIDTNNVLLEYCTGTWCGYCPCAHQIINQAILPTYPNTVIIAYHGTSSDPWYAYSQTMLSTFGYSGYPTGVIGRTSGIQSRSAWFSFISAQATYQPGIKVEMQNKVYDAGTRLLSATVNITALQDLPAGQYNIFYVITEDHLVYQQNHYSACGYSGYITDYVHNHVCKLAVDAPYGEMITNATWTNGTVQTKQLSITLPTHVNYSNAHVNVIVYKYGSPLTNSAAVQNSISTPGSTFAVTGVSSIKELTADKYELGQNYPNPFNPQTKINFSVPKADFVSLKFYDIRGKEVASYLNNYYLTPGVYSAEFDGSDLPSGVYFYSLTSKNFTATKKMILVK